VLDIDSPVHARFDESDKVLFEAIATIYAEACATA